MIKKAKEVRNLIKIENELHTLELLEKIIQGEKVAVFVNPNGKGNTLVWNGKCIFIFDGCKFGNQYYNAVSVIRDLLKQYDPKRHWTRKIIEPLLDFPAKNCARSPVEEEETEMK
jgi:hypothetical protein